MSALKKKKYWANHEEELAKMTKSRLKAENILQRKEYYQKNKDEYFERHKKYMADEQKKANRYKKSSELYFNNKEAIRERHKKNYDKPETKQMQRDRHNKRKQTDIQYVIKRRLRFRLRHVVKQYGVKKDSAIELLGCTIEQFKIHIQSLFKDGMTWDLVLKAEIHIDHKTPCSWFDLTNIEEQRKCFHYTNLQPLWKLDNLSKNNRYAA
jgi:hypothetical protein